MEIIEEAKSKINISLNLTGKKENNFHQLLSFICFSNLSDQLILTKSDFFDYEIHSSFEKIPYKDDLILKTIEAVKKYLKLTDLPPFKLILKKNIPLVFYGENEAEYGNPIADNVVSLRDKSFYIAKKLNNLYLAGVPVPKLISKHKLKLVDLKLYKKHYKY